jgi:hypothetical protein
MLCLSYYCYVYSSTKFEKRAEQVLPGIKGVEERRRGWGAGGRNGPNNVCTYEKKSVKKTEIEGSYFIIKSI